MAPKGGVRVNITGDSSQLDRELTKADRAVGRFASDTDRNTRKISESTGKAAADTEKHASRMSSAFSSVAPSLATGVAAFGAFALYGIKAASDVGESMNVAGHVFGDMADEMDWFAKNAANTAGMSEREFLGISTSIGALLIPMGLVQDEAAKMSASLTQRAADIGSFYNATAEEVSAAMTSALAGETEPMRKFGVFLDQDRISAEALSLGLATAPVDMAKVERAQLDITKAQQKYNEAVAKYGPASVEAKDAQLKITESQAKLSKALKGGKVDLDAAAKAQAIYSLVMKDSTLAAGDFAETVGTSLPNKTKQAKAQFENLATELGEKLLPIAIEVMDKVIGGLNAVTDWWNGDGKAWVEGFKQGWRDLGAGVDELQVQWDEFVESYEGWTGESGGITEFSRFMDEAGWGVDEFERGIDDLKAGWGEVVAYFPVGARMIGGALWEIGSNMATILGWIGGVVDWVFEKLGAVADKVQDVLGPVGDFLGGTFDTLNPFSGMWNSAQDLFRAEGGPVMAGRPYIVGERGPELIVPGASGTVVPNHALSAGGGGSQTINLVVDGRVLASVVTPHLTADRRSRTGSRKVA